MDYPFEAEKDQAEAPEKIVYVRPVAVEDLPEDLREQAEGLTDLHAVHSPDGERLALVRDRKLAFALARKNNFAPVSVH